MRLFHTNAVNDQAPHVATWARQPRHLAHNEADAVAIVAAVAMGCLTLIVCAIVGLFLHVDISPWAVVVAVLVEAIIVLLIWIGVYAYEMFRMTGHAKRSTWQLPVPPPSKQQDAPVEQDYFIWKPLKGEPEIIPVDWRFANDPATWITLDKDGKDRLKASELVEFIGLCETKGMTDGALTGSILRSGRKLSQRNVRDIRDQMVPAGMADVIGGKWSLKVTQQEAAEAALRYVTSRQRAGTT